jgi:hypothetical protein
MGQDTFLLQSVGNKLYYLASPNDKEDSMVLMQESGKIYWTI